jgi:LysM repeat protein
MRKLSGQYFKFDVRLNISMHKRIFFSVIGLLFLALGSGSASPVDSLRVEYIDGKAYIIHEVDPGETLYSISKRYKSSMNAIADATPAVKKGLHDGMLLQIPYKPQVSKSLKQQTHVVAQGETLYSISRIYDISVVEIMEWNDLLSSELEIGQELKIGGKSQPQKIDYVLDGMRIHVVQAGEGLYALARNFDVTVDELVAWNELESSSLNLGQEVIVGKVGAVAETATVVETEAVEGVMAAPAVFVPMVKAKENGMAASIEGESDETFLAMHREITVGSIVAVRNEMNNQVVFVRIVGKLPDTGVNDRVIIRLSSGAVRQLQAIDPKFRVEISYLVPE